MLHTITTTRQPACNCMHHAGCGNIPCG
jgi:hypothetical protein